MEDHSTPMVALKAVTRLILQLEKSSSPDQYDAALRPSWCTKSATHGMIESYTTVVKTHPEPVTLDMISAKLLETKSLSQSEMASKPESGFTPSGIDSILIRLELTYYPIIRTPNKELSPQVFAKFNRAFKACAVDSKQRENSSQPPNLSVSQVYKWFTSKKGKQHLVKEGQVDIFVEHGIDDAGVVPELALPALVNEVVLDDVVSEAEYDPMILTQPESEQAATENQGDEEQLFGDDLEGKEGDDLEGEEGDDLEGEEGDEKRFLGDDLEGEEVENSDEDDDLVDVECHTTSSNDDDGNREARRVEVEAENVGENVNEEVESQYYDSENPQDINLNTRRNDHHFNNRRRQ
nr:hypothetical protein Iba_chr06aCG11640 [Ipomoea batatas]